MNREGKKGKVRRIVGYVIIGLGILLTAAQLGQLLSGIPILYVLPRLAIAILILVIGFVIRG